jgi:hypothetical protein
MNKELQTSLNLDLNDRNEIEKWCNIFECSEDTLRYCTQYVGRSIISIESFLSMNKNWISARDKGAA